MTPTPIIPNAVYSDKEAAPIILKDKCKPTSWKSVQAAIRRGELKGRHFGRSYQILGSDLMDFISYRRRDI